MILNLIVAILAAVGLLLMVGIDPVTFQKKIFAVVENRPRTMRDEILAANGERPSHLFAGQFQMMKKTLELTGRGDEYGRFYTVSAICALAGIALAVTMDNFFLVPILGAVGLLVPPIYVLATAASYSKMVNTQTGSALSLITNVYVRTENLLRAIKGQLPIIRGPVKKVLSRFVAKTEYVSGNIEQALQEMSLELDNGVFREWCKILELCQHDRTQIGMLQPLLDSQHNMEIIQIDVDAQAPAEMKECKMAALFVVGVYGLLVICDMDWFLYMFTTIPGKIVTAGAAAVLLFLLYRVTKVLQPVRR